MLNLVCIKSILKPQNIAFKFTNMQTAKVLIQKLKPYKHNILCKTDWICHNKTKWWM